MPKRITSNGKPNGQPKLERTVGTRVAPCKPKVNKTPCSLCHQVVEELKYHYDICEECHLSTEDGSDTEEVSISEERDMGSSSGRPADFDLDSDEDVSDDVNSEEESDDILIEDVVAKRK